MRRSITLQGETYNKTKFEAKWSEIVNSTECNYFVRGDSAEFLLEVGKVCPKWEKIACRDGVKFKIRNKKFQGRAVRGVVMITPNSQREIWMGKAAVVGQLFPKDEPVCEHRQNKKDALAALRQLIEPQIRTFRTSVLRQLNKKPLRCPLSREFMEKGQIHIDHVYPFKNLVEEWCRENKLDLERIDVKCRGVKCYLTNTDLAESFFDYHMMNARLQAVSAKANLKKGAKYLGES